MPGVSLRVLGEAETNLDELRRGNIDVQLIDQTTHPADVLWTTVMTDRAATVARRDLPMDPTTMDGFTALAHVVISRRGRLHNVVDDLLREYGLSRRVAVTVPTVDAALQAVAAAELVTTVPATLTAHQLGPALQSYALPLPTPEIPAVMAWHKRHETDGANRWLRALISETLASITPA